MRAVIVAVLAFLHLPLAFGATPAPNGPRTGRWAHEGGKVPPDERVIWGRLDNGFRYAVLPHKGVPGRVALQLIVLSGSLDEQSNELGIAHFTEHVAFGGSRNFKSEDMVALFQRLGIEYGSDVNAITTHDHTAYRLDFRENDPELVKTGILLLRDFGDGVTFSPAVIEQERRVVLAELRNRNTIAGRRMEASMPIVFRGLTFPHRGPGGSEGLIASFTRDQFLRFYERCYRSDLMVMVAVGDFDPAAMTSLIRESFASMAKPAAPVPPRDEGRLDARTMRAGIFRVAGVGSASAEVASVAPLVRGDPRQAEIDRQRREFVMELFADRLESDLQEGGNPNTGYEEILGYGAAQASALMPAKAWAKGLTELDGMVRFSLERGLDPADLETLRRQRLKLATTMAEQLPTLDPGVLLEALTDSITNHTVYFGLERKYAWMREWLERFTPAEAQQVFRGLWQPAGMAFHVSGGVDMELTEAKVLAEVQKGRRAGFNPLLAHTQRITPYALPKWSTPTEVAERRPLPALGATLMRFGNNVRLNFAPNKSEPGLVHAIVRVGSGLLEMPGNKPALKEFGLNTLLASGSAHFRPEVMNGLIDERLLDFGFDLADRDAFTFRGVMPAEQLEVFLAIVTDILHAPQFNRYVHEESRMQAAMGREMRSVGMSEGMRGLMDHLFKGDARFTWGSPIDYLAMSVVDVRRWMEPSLTKGYLEVTLVGDIPEDAAVRTMSRTLGSLRPRAADKALAVQPKPVAVTAPAGFTRIEFVGEQNVGMVVTTWPVTEPMRIRDRAALELLAKILELRVRAEVREKLGLAYSPAANFTAYDGFAGFALMRAQIDASPNDTTRVAPLIETIGATLAQEGVTEGEFVGARGILRSKLRQAFREGGFVATMLMRAQERPEETEEIVSLHGGLADTITREEVNAWAAKILVKTNCRNAAVVPKAFVGMFEATR